MAKIGAVAVEKNLATQIHGMFRAYEKRWRAESATHSNYPHIQPFALGEIQDFLDDKPGKKIGKGYDAVTRSHEVRLVFSWFAAEIVDTRKGSPAHVGLYKKVSEIKIPTACKYCGAKVANSLLSGWRKQVCTKSRCQLQNMRDRI